jgi:uncharacterized paraquat-inducible protein A
MEKFILARKDKWLAALIFLLILTALYFNIIALRFPFVSVKQPFLSIPHLFEHSEIYTFWGFANLLEEEYDFYLGAMLTIIFSIIFPFVKLLSLLIICLIIRSSKIRIWIVTFFKSFDKWAFIGVFNLFVFFVLRSTKKNATITPQPGIYYFILAILIGNICTILVYSLCLKTDSTYSEMLKSFICFVKKSIFPVEKILLLIFLSIGFLCFILALICNNIHISSFSFSRYVNSIINCWHSIQQASNTLALFVALVLIIIPFLFYINQFIFWGTSYHPDFHLRMAKLINRSSHFVMLDVLFLSLFLYTIEAISKMKIRSENIFGLHVEVLLLFFAFFFPVFNKLYCLFRYSMEYKNSNKNKI